VYYIILHYIILYYIFFISACCTVKLTSYSLLQIMSFETFTTNLY